MSRQKVGGAWTSSMHSSLGLQSRKGKSPSSVFYSLSQNGRFEGCTHHWRGRAEQRDGSTIPPGLSGSCNELRDDKR